MTDNCAANVYKLGGSLVASTETCLLRRIDGDTLDTQEKIDMSGLVNIASARALIDPDTKDVFNIAGKDTKAWTIWIPIGIWQSHMSTIDGDWWRNYAQYTVVQPTNRVGTLGYDLVWHLSDAWQKTS